VFHRLIEKAKSKLTGIALSYLEWAAVGVPFLLALGFALAAVHAMLIEHFGRVVANWAMAGGLAAIGACGGLVLKVAEQRDAAPEGSHAGIFPSSFSGAPSSLIHAAPAALNLVSGLWTKPSRMGRLARECAPLLALAGLITLLMWPKLPEGVTRDDEPDTHLPDQEGLGVPSGHTAVMRVAAQKLLTDPLF
jgi:hypothetical protein